MYVYLSCAWIMWLLVKYYSAYVILRQRFLTSGEASINEWHEQYMQGSLDKTGKEEGKGVLAALKHFKQLFDPSEVCRSWHFPMCHFHWSYRRDRKGIENKNYTFRRQFNDRISIIPGCPGPQGKDVACMNAAQDHHARQGISKCEPCYCFLV